MINKGNTIVPCRLYTILTKVLKNVWWISNWSKLSLKRVCVLIATSSVQLSIPLSIAEGFYLSVSYIYRGFLWPISLVVKSQANSVVLLDIHNKRLINSNLCFFFEISFSPVKKINLIKMVSQSCIWYILILYFSYLVQIKELQEKWLTFTLYRHHQMASHRVTLVLRLEPLLLPLESTH